MGCTIYSFTLYYALPQATLCRFGSPIFSPQIPWRACSACSQTGEICTYQIFESKFGFRSQALIQLSVQVVTPKSTMNVGNVIFSEKSATYSCWFFSKLLNAWSGLTGALVALLRQWDAPLVSKIDRPYCQLTCQGRSYREVLGCPDPPPPLSHSSSTPPLTKRHFEWWAVRLDLVT